ncbi:MAG: biopolymer transporter ExbD [Alphaproteobacteria bacterium]|nr:biopolymer transporter ExbD [Alphaproteobacteria bacterium]
MAFSSKPSGESEQVYAPLAEINVTPFIDVMLVLLVIFMVTAPMLAAGVKVELPKASTAQPLDPRDPLVVTVATGPKVYLGAEEVERGRLVELVRDRLLGERRVVHVRGDSGANYGDVVGVLDDLAAAGISQLSIVTRQKPRAEGAGP